MWNVVLFVNQATYQNFASFVHHRGLGVINGPVCIDFAWFIVDGCI